MKAKHQRLTLVILALVAIGGAAVLALSGLKSQANFFYTPSDVKKDGVPLGQRARLGGMVVKGSLKKAPDGVTMHFIVSDEHATTPVTFAGIAPDLFREGSGVVAEGRFNPDASFTADNLLAKHDEKYMPPQAAGAMHESKSLEK